MIRILLTGTILAVMPLAAWADDIVATSRITDVTVYADRATVTRTAEVELPAGASTVVLNDLPQDLFPESLRSEGQSNAGVVLGALENKLVSSAELAAPRERELSDKLQGLQDQRGLVVAEQQALSQKREFLSNLSQQASMRAREDIATIDLKPEQWKAAAETVAASQAETLRGLAGKLVELRELDKQIAALQSELSQLRTGARASYRVALPVEAARGGRLVVKVSYQIGNAGWEPIYDARLETETGKLGLTQYGDVRQQTGEDWSNVKLTLSTAQPARSADLPELSPMWVSLYDPNAYRRANRAEIGAFAGAADSAVMQKAAPAPAMMAAESAVAEDKMEEVAFRPATLNAGGYVAEYAIAGENDVLADGTSRKVMMGKLDVSSDLMVKVKPAFSSDAFLVAVTKLGGEVPLLPGQASLFRDGAFIGTMSLPMLRPGEQTDLSFGVDDQIAVKQRVEKDESGESGVISKDSTRIRQTVLTVQNLHKMPVKLAVQQTIPAPQNEQIKVVLDKAYTTPGYSENVDRITGQLRWDMTLQPQQKSDVKLGWTISWPKEQQLSGLPF